MAVSGATIIELLGNAGDQIQYTVASGTAISAGTLLVIGSDPRTAIASAVADATIATRRPFAGIAAADKTAADGATTISVYTNVIADIYAGGVASVVGEIVAIGGANIVVPAAAADLISGAVVGKAMETGSVDEKHAVKLRFI